MPAMIVTQIKVISGRKIISKNIMVKEKSSLMLSVLSDGYLQKEGADTSLIRLIKSDLYPEIVRATAIQIFISL